MTATPICHKHVLREWLKSEYIFEGNKYSTEAGTPQGGIISPTLCNIALNGVEADIRQNYPVNIKGGRPKVYVCRYADDMVITGNKKETLLQVKEILHKFLAIRGLELKEAKTRLVTIHFHEGFDFLGFNITRKDYNPTLNKPTHQPTVLIIKPSYKAISSITSKIKTILRTNGQEIAKVVKVLNPVLRGWTNYFKISYHSQQTFIRVGHYVWTSMMKRVKRKHPHISIDRALKRYLVTGKTNSRHKWV